MDNSVSVDFRQLPPPKVEASESLVDWLHDSPTEWTSECDGSIDILTDRGIVNIPAEGWVLKGPNKELWPASCWIKSNEFFRAVRGM